MVKVYRTLPTSIESVVTNDGTQLYRERKLWRAFARALQNAKRITASEIASQPHPIKKLQANISASNKPISSASFVWHELNEALKQVNEIATQLQLIRPFTVDSEFSLLGKHYEWFSTYSPNKTCLYSFNLGRYLQKCWYYFCSLIDENLGWWISFASEQISRPRRHPLVGKPRWDKCTKSLYVGDTLVRKLYRVTQKGKPTNIAIVLNVFEESRWPESIDDPLPGGANPERLRDTIRSLNALASGIRFYKDEAGRIRWQTEAVE